MFDTILQKEVQDFINLNLFSDVQKLALKKNPFPDLAPQGRPWVGDFWDFFYAGHTVELDNLKAILEYRHANNLPMTPKEL